MKFGMLDSHCKEDVEHLFTSVFSSSEGKQEGKLVGDLASSLAEHIDNQDIICIGADVDKVIIAAIFFTRLRFDESIDVFMLAPVAVSTANQGRGVGRSLINFGLRELKNRSVELVTTYGDPAFYSRVGFNPLSEEIIQAPLQLSMPEGWLGQSLLEATMPVLRSRPSCVKQFDNADYW